MDCASLEVKFSCTKIIQKSYKPLYVQTIYTSLFTEEETQIVAKIRKIYSATLGIRENLNCGSIIFQSHHTGTHFKI